MQKMPCATLGQSKCVGFCTICIHRLLDAHESRAATLSVALRKRRICHKEMLHLLVATTATTVYDYMTNFPMYQTM